jgi:hypothetical protein
VCGPPGPCHATSMLDAWSRIFEKTVREQASRPADVHGLSSVTCHPHDMECWRAAYNSVLCSRALSPNILMD